jgi:hypothetical protein
MSLSPEFFDGREALIREREAAGDIELEHFLKRRRVSIDRLYRLGLLMDERGFVTTADLFVHQITELGRQFMDDVEDFQLIFVRGEAAASFGSFLRMAGS